MHLAARVDNCASRAGESLPHFAAMSRRFLAASRTLKVTRTSPTYSCKRVNMLTSDTLTKRKQSIARRLRAEPYNAQAYIGVGTCRHELGDDTGAEQNYRKALQLDPHSVNALIGLGSTAAVRADYKGAENYYRKAVALAPGLADAHAGLASCTIARAVLPRRSRSIEKSFALHRERSWHETHSNALTT